MKKTNWFILKLVFLIALSVAVTGCNEQNKDTTSKAENPTIPVLNKTNIRAFSLNLQQDYDLSLNSLIEQFNLAQENGDSYSFVSYRNHKWTPVYMEKKDFYAAVFNQNKAYLETSSIAPLFNLFESLIYVGLNLKHGLLDNDKTVIEQALADAKNEQTLVHSIVASTK